MTVKNARWSDVFGTIGLLMLATFFHARLNARDVAFLALFRRSRSN